MGEVDPDVTNHGDPPERETAPRLVVGLGASAGGIKALQEFFTRVPPDSGVAFVVVLHLSPEHESHLAEVLQVSARIPVVRATETLLVEPNHVYVISPNTSLRMADGHLTVSDTRQMDERRSPVDIFFRTLADTHGARAVSIVLSGTGPDGSSGLKRVKEHGGVIMAQEPRESDHDDMPRNAIAHRARGPHPAGRRDGVADRGAGSPPRTRAGAGTRSRGARAWTACPKS